MENPNLLSPSVLCFVGDAVYGLYVKTALAEINRPSGELHILLLKIRLKQNIISQQGLNVCLDICIYPMKTTEHMNYLA